MTAIHGRKKALITDSCTDYINYDRLKTLYCMTIIALRKSVLKKSISFSGMPIPVTWAPFCNS